MGKYIDVIGYVQERDATHLCVSRFAPVSEVTLIYYIIGIEVHPVL